MQYLLIIIGTLLFAGCGDSTQKQQSLAAQQMAERTRESWDKSRRPFTIRLEGLSGQGGGALRQIGVFAHLKDAMAEERAAFSGVAFDLQGDSYQTRNRNAVSTDSTAQVFVCYPYHNGLRATDTLQLKAPFGENLYGRETERTSGKSVSVKMSMQSAMALLRITCESNDVQDRLDALSILGDGIYTSAGYLPYLGKWTGHKADGGIDATQADCLLNNGREHAFYLVPTETAGTVTLYARINGNSHAVKITLPPLRAGSMTQLNLRLAKQGLSVGSSWVDSSRPLSGIQPTIEPDTIKVGHYLQQGGYIRMQRDSNSVAVIIQTDGKHGKAVALKDCEGKFFFSGCPLTSGKIFTTIDGKRKEGVVNPGQKQHVNDTERIIFKSDIPYDVRCALGYGNGAELTRLLKERAEMQKSGNGKMRAEAGGKPIQEKEIPIPIEPSLVIRKTMLEEIQRHPGSYVPSLRELTALYHQLYSDRKNPLNGLFELPTGEYLTSSEASNETFYLMDMGNGIITGTLSKQYARMQLRLFYLF